MRFVVVSMFVDFAPFSFWISVRGRFRLALSVAAVAALVSCSSAHHVTHTSCSVAAQTQTCHDKCAGFGDDSRPLWCYRLFCVHGAPIYGSWCSASNTAVAPTAAELLAVTSSPAYQSFTGLAHAPTNAHINDNGLAFLAAVANKMPAADKTMVAVAYLGEGAVNHGSMITGNFERRVFGFDPSYATNPPVMQDPSSGGYGDVTNIPKNSFYSGSVLGAAPATFPSLVPLAGDVVDVINIAGAKTGAEYFYRGGTSYVARLLGFSLNGVTSMSAVDLQTSSTRVYNFFDDVLFSSRFYGNSIYNGGSPGVILTSPITSHGPIDTMDGGANYRFLPAKFQTAIADLTHNSAGQLQDPSYRFVADISFEGMRDDRQLAYGFDIMRNIQGSPLRNGVGGGYGEGNVSYMLVNICPPDAPACFLDPSSYTGRFINATFALSLQAMFAKFSDSPASGFSYYLNDVYANPADKRPNYVCRNVFRSDDLVQMASTIGSSLESFRNGFFVAPAGSSAVNNAGGAYGLFYPTGHAINPASADSWDHQRVWYRSENIFQTSGAVDSNIYYPKIHPISGRSMDYFMPNLIFGNVPGTVTSPFTTSIVNQREPGTAYIYWNYSVVQDQTIAATAAGLGGGSLDMSKTGNYPSAFLQMLWLNDFSKTGADRKDPSKFNIYHMSPLMAWSNWNTMTPHSNNGLQANVINYEGTNAYAQFLLGKGNPNLSIPTYSSSPYYRFLVAGAFDSTADGGMGSLVAYTNQAGSLKYNFLTVNVNNYQDVLSTASGHSYVKGDPTGVDGIQTGAGPNAGDADKDYAVGTGFYALGAANVRGERFAHYRASPSLLAASTLTGYVERLQSIFPNALGNDVAFVMRQTATPMYGRNFDMDLDGSVRHISQAVYYFTHDISSVFTDTGVDPEQDSLNFLNAAGGKDVFVFTGVQNAKGYDYMDHQMFTDAGHHGVASLTAGKLAPELFGEGHVTANTGFFIGAADWSVTRVGTTGPWTISAKVGPDTYMSYRTGAVSPLNVVDHALDVFDVPTEFAKLNGLRNIDTNQRIGGTGGATDAPDSFMTIDLGSRFWAKFNWQDQPKAYYDTDFVGCAAGVSCTQDSYNHYLEIYYDRLGTPENERKIIDLNVAADGSVTRCSGTSCSYKFTDGGYDNIHLTMFNEHRNVLMLGVDDPTGMYNYHSKRVHMEVMVLDPGIIACPGGQCGAGPNGGNSLTELSYFKELNDVIDGKGSGVSAAAWSSRLAQLGMQRIAEARVTDACITDLQCTHQDLLIMFKLRPDLFDRAPSNVYGYGNVDLQGAYGQLHYQDTTFYSGVAGSLSKNLQQFFYNPDCAGGNCGVKLSDEMAFDYKPNQNHPVATTPGDTHRGRIDSGGAAGAFVHTPYGDTPLSVDDVQHAVDYVNGHAGMNVGFVLGAMGPAIGFNNMRSVQTAKNPFGSSLSFNTPMMNGSVMIGGKYFSAHEFSNYSITNVDRNTDQFGYAIIDGFTSANVAMLSGVRFGQDLGPNAQMKMMFYGNKNEHDLINNNPIGALVGGNSLYMLSSNQQGMFGNPYFRYAGGYMGSIYSFSGNLSDNWQYRFSTAQMQNPIASVFHGMNAGVGSGGGSVQNTTMNSLLGYGASSGNSLQEFQLMYNGKDKSSYSFGYGMLYENESVIGTAMNPGGKTNTYYFDAKMVQHLGKGFYLLGHYNFGVADVTTVAGSPFSGFNSILAQKFSIGLVKENFFGGSLFFTYTEPNRVLLGSTHLMAFDANAHIMEAGAVNLAHLGFKVERNYELGYGFQYKGYNIAFSSIVRTNPYSLPKIDADGLLMLRINGAL